MTGLFQSIITVVLFILILGVLVVIHELGHFVTARPCQASGSSSSASASRRGPRSCASSGETALHAQLAADRRLREARRRGRRPTPTIRAPSRTQGLPDQALILVAGVAMNVAPGLRHLHRHRLARRRRSSASVLRGPARTRRPPRPACSRVSDRRHRRPALPVLRRPDAITGLRDRRRRDLTLTSRDADGTQRDVPSRSGRRPRSTPRRARWASRREQAVRGLLLRPVRHQRPADGDPDRGRARRSAGSG